MTPPLVALTSTTKVIDGLTRVRLNEAYVDAARLAGLVPIVVPPLPPDALPAILDAVDGLILTGGEDVDPRAYGAAPSPRTEGIHAERDRCELALVRLAHERRMPTLAICRGIQVANVAFGGTLIQDIPTERRSDIDHDLSKEREQRVHAVTVDRDTRLAQALGETSLRVNSSHHQALDRAAAGLRVTARAPDGIVEGAEWVADDWWMLAVQWHPEELIKTRESWDRGLFQAFRDRLLSDA